MLGCEAADAGTNPERRARAPGECPNGPQRTGELRSTVRAGLVSADPIAVVERLWTNR
jgi:hypothetical protein